MDFFRGPPSSFSRRDVKLRTERRERISIEGWTIRTRYGDGETKKRIDGIIGAPEWKIDRIGGREGVRRTTAALGWGGRGERDGLAGRRARVDGQIRSLSAV